MVEAVLTDLAARRRREACCAFVNGMGGTPQLELYLLYGEVDALLRDARPRAGAQPGRQLHHLARDGRRVADAARARRRARPRSGMLPSTPPALRWGRLTAVIAESVSATRRRSPPGCTEIGASVRAQRDYLTQLDAAIGDGDHGINMDRGFDAVGEALAGRGGRPARPAARSLAGKTLVVDGRRRERAAVGIGVARGPGARSATPPRSTAPQLAEALEAALAASSRPRRRQRGRQDDGRRARARASTRCAAHVDAGEPLAQALAPPRRRPPRRAREATVPLQARKGRASYLGERSIGHQDPGATSAALIMRALERAVSRGG